jgi:tRNA dimethylallyltransferase
MNNMSDKHLVVLAGPTASGKTACAIQLAKAFQTVIISSDSRQFYKEMSIGTAVPNIKELNEVKHYNIQNISIFDSYSIADFEKDVMTLLIELWKKHDVVIMTGGSGLFIDAVCNGIDPMPDIDPSVRAKVESFYRKNGIAGMQEELQKLDPEYYAIVDKQNPRRLQRALEVCYKTGLPFTTFRKRSAALRDFKIIKLALLWERQLLYNRINIRVEQMLAHGLVEEARKLYPYRSLNALNTVGYKELFEYFDGNCSLEDAIEQIKMNTRHYAKRQMTWFKKDETYHWVEPYDIKTILMFVKSEINACH